MHSFRKYHLTETVNFSLITLKITLSSEFWLYNLWIIMPLGTYTLLYPHHLTRGQREVETLSSTGDVMFSINLFFISNLIVNVSIFLWMMTEYLTMYLKHLNISWSKIWTTKRNFIWCRKLNRCWLIIRKVTLLLDFSLMQHHNVSSLPLPCFLLFPLPPIRHWSSW